MTDPTVPEFPLRAPLEMHDWSSISSNVHSALYDFGERELYMRYKRDGADALYQYDAVPASEWSGLVEASSKGGYINRNVAYAYRYTRIGISEFPDAGRGVAHPVARRFLTAPMTLNTEAAHPHR